jgi:hypothetical protein
VFGGLFLYGLRIEFSARADGPESELMVTESDWN